jgi:hypothetical protein
LTVNLYRGQDQKLVVEINSSGLSADDEHGNGVPNIRIWINEQKVELTVDGSILTDVTERCGKDK